MRQWCSPITRVAIRASSAVLLVPSAKKMRSADTPCWMAARRHTAAADRRSSLKPPVQMMYGALPAFQTSTACAMRLARSELGRPSGSHARAEHDDDVRLARIIALSQAVHLPGEEREAKQDGERPQDEHQPQSTSHATAHTLHGR